LSRVVWRSLSWALAAVMRHLGRGSRRRLCRERKLRRGTRRRRDKVVFHGMACAEFIRICVDLKRRASLFRSGHGRWQLLAQWLRAWLIWPLAAVLILFVGMLVKAGSLLRGKPVTIERIRVMRHFLPIGLLLIAGSIVACNRCIYTLEASLRLRVTARFIWVGHRLIALLILSVHRIRSASNMLGRNAGLAEKIIRGCRSVLGRLRTSRFRARFRTTSTRSAEKAAQARKTFLSRVILR
jgi:hypothetical protein